MGSSNETQAGDIAQGTVTSSDGLSIHLTQIWRHRDLRRQQLLRAEDQGSLSLKG